MLLPADKYKGMMGTSKVHPMWCLIWHKLSIAVHGTRPVVISSLQVTCPGRGWLDMNERRFILDQSRKLLM